MLLSNRLLYALTTFFLLAAPRLEAQIQLSEMRWSTENGLPSNDLFEVVQDKEGFIWVGTDNGLARFDGVRFEVFNRANTPEITRNLVRALYVKENGDLLIGLSGGGIVRYRDGVFSRPYDHIIPDEMFVLSITSTPSATYIGSDGDGLYRILHDDSVQIFREDEIQNNHIFSLATFHDTKVIASIGYLGLIYIVDGRPVFPDLPDGYGQSYVYDIQIIDDKIWTASSGSGIQIIEGDDFRRFSMRGHSSLSHMSISLQEDNYGRIWIGTLEGIFYTDDDMQTINPYPGLEQSFSMSILNDREGNIWIADWGAGLVRLRYGTFSAYREIAGHELQTGTSVAKIDSTLWVASYNGLFRIEADGRQTRFTSADGLQTDFPHLILRDHENNLIVSHFDFGTSLDIIRNGSIEPHPLNYIFDEPSPSIYVLYEDEQTNLWIGTDRGLIAHYEDEPLYFRTDKGLANENIRALYRREDTLWIGTNGGLHRMIVGSGKIDFVTDANSSLGSVITSITEDRFGNLWIGTFDAGLSLYKNDRFYQFNQTTGLPTDVVWSVTEDDYGYFWLASTNGVTRVSRDEMLQKARDNDIHKLEDILFFTRQDGLSGNGIYGNHQPTVYKEPGGFIYLPAAGGLSILDPGSLRINTLPPKIHITNILVDLEAVQDKTTDLTLTHVNRALEIRYTSPSFTAPERVTFRYRLYPFQRDWQDVGSRRTAYFTTIPHGNYEFQVAAINENGVISEHYAALPVIVKPAFWETWWFFLTIAAAVFLTAYGGYRYKVLNYERMNKLRLRISKDLHDEIGSNLASISIRSSVIQKKEQLRPDARHELIEIQNLSRMTSESMRDIVWFINPDNDRLENLLVKMREVAGGLLHDTDWYFNSDLDFNRETLNLQQRRALLLILKEALHNIVKHAEATKVTIDFTKKGSKLQLIIADNGKGFEQSGLRHSGLGLKSMRERAADINGTLDIQAEAGNGTHIKLSLKL
ncbi:MAG: histidine kinase [Balneolales bacterium]|nr:histidine kinase [Balneolales bacterium]